jgi:signal transduction histidine kinase
MILAAVSAAGIMVCAAAVAITLSGGQSANPALDAEIRAAIIAAPIAVGLFVWYRDPWRRFGKLLVAAGFAWSLTALAQSNDDFLYSLGRVFGWLVEPLLIYLFLAFPSGRLTTTPARRLAAATALLIALLYLPTALLVDTYPTPSPWTNCQGAECPQNAFMLAGSEPAFIGDLIVPVRDILATILLLGVIAVLGTRIKRGSNLRRITLVPVLTVAILHALAIAAGIVLRRGAPDSAVAEAVSSVAALSFGGVALGFLAALSGWRLFESRALRRLVAGLASHPPGLNLRETSELLSDAIDPTVGVIYRPRDDPDGWRDMEGLPVRISAEDLVCMTPITKDDERVIAVIHDAALKDAPLFLDIANSSILRALENERIGSKLRESLRELNESRARILSSADRERQRIERDLHDGAQQALVALRIRLDLAAELLKENPAHAERVLRELRGEVDGTLEQVRSLAHGVYPSHLADRGLRDALRSAARRNPVPTAVDANGIGRYAPDIEAAIYFCCLEAMQNAMKHARGLGSISVSLAERDDLRFEVSNDGDGFVENGVGSGMGLSNMRDRLAAVGGVLTIASAPGAGTKVLGVVPITTNGSNGASRAQSALSAPEASIGSSPAL